MVRVCFCTLSGDLVCVDKGTCEVCSRDGDETFEAGEFERWWLAQEGYGIRAERFSSPAEAARAAWDVVSERLRRAEEYIEACGRSIKYEDFLNEFYPEEDDVGNDEYDGYDDDDTSDA